LRCVHVAQAEMLCAALGATAVTAELVAEMVDGDEVACGRMRP